jgi:2-polyprenyl-3-methyl-5-hydroxy-6-metoxy-1,4-benzoquinol methylase
MEAATMNLTNTADYVLGHSTREIQRLMLQAAIIGPVTERLLRTINISPGMRVLDLGCGPGDVSLLAAKFVGPTGLVVGIDRNRDVLALAAERARVAGFQYLQFEHSSAEAFSSQQPFDLVIGRYVLVHQPDPVEFLRTIGRLVNRGGYIAFHEVRLSKGLDSMPTVPLWQATASFLQLAWQSALPHYSLADRFIELFLHAGLPIPNLLCETPMGGGSASPIYAWVSETLQSFLPQLRKIGISAECLQVESLEGRLREAVVSAKSQIECAAQVCAWTTI